MKQAMQVFWLMAMPGLLMAEFARVVLENIQAQADSVNGSALWQWLRAADEWINLRLAVTLVMMYLLIAVVWWVFRLICKLTPVID
jgi:hypothetical protein